MHKYIPALLLTAITLSACSERDLAPVSPECGRLEYISLPRPASSEHDPGAELMYEFLAQGSIERADELLRDVWTLPRTTSVELPVEDLTWTEDPFGEKYWRFLFYSLRHLRHLVFAWETTGEARYRDKIVDILEHFTAHRAVCAPYVQDKHTSAFLAMQLTQLYWKLDADGALTDELAGALLIDIWNRARFLSLEKNFEGDYNHGLTQAFALLLVTKNFPDFPQAQAWRTLALERVSHLLDTNIAADGVQIEQSTFYHFYVLKFFWQLHAWASMYDVDVDPAVERAIASMVEYAAHVIYPDGSIPLMGSSNPLSVRDTTDLVLLDIAIASDPLAFLVSGGSRGSPPEPRNVLFEESGVAILRSGFGEEHKARYEDTTQVVFDVGPYRTNHSHLDALQVLLYSGGRELVIDSGLFTYERRDPAYPYFRSTAAHNTVSVDGSSQRKGGATQGALKSHDGGASISGAHQLYRRATHGRAVALLERGLVVVHDTLEAEGRREFTQHWHLFHGASPDFDEAGRAVHVTDERDDRVLSIYQRGDLESGDMALYSGSEDPWSGWSAPRYEVRQPIWTLRSKTRGDSATFVTVFAANEHALKAWNVTVARGDGEDLVEVHSKGDTDHTPGYTVRIEHDVTPARVHVMKSSH